MSITQHTISATMAEPHYVVVSETPVWRDDFQGTMSWTSFAFAIPTKVLNTRTGRFEMKVTSTDVTAPLNAQVQRTATGLTVGKTYRAVAHGYASASVTAYLTASGSSAAIPLSPTPQQVEGAPFTATATTRNLVLSTTAAAGPAGEPITYWQDVLVYELESQATLDLRPTQAQVTLDESWSPYARAVIECPIPAKDVLAKIDPREEKRVSVTLARTNVSGARTNLVPNPSFETDTSGYSTSGSILLSRVTSLTPQSGTRALAVTGNKVLSTIARTNLVPNPSFEVNTTGWSATVNSTIARTTAAFNSGTAALALTSSAAGTAQTGIPTGLGGFPVVAGQTYRFSVFSRAATVGRAVLIGWSWYDAAGASVAGGSNSTFGSNGTAGWTSHSTTQVAPALAAFARIYLGASATAAAGEVHYFDSVMVSLASEAPAYFDGSTASGGGTTYAWTGTAHASASTETVVTGGGVDEPDGVLVFPSVPITAGLAYTASAYLRAAATARTIDMTLTWYNGASPISTSTVSSVTNTTAGWTRLSKTATAPAVTTAVVVKVEWSTIAYGEVQYLDAVLIEQASSAGTYFDGSTADTSALIYDWTGTPHASASTVATVTASPSPPVTRTFDLGLRSRSLDYVNGVMVLELTGDEMLLQDQARWIPATYPQQVPPTTTSLKTLVNWGLGLIGATLHSSSSDATIVPSDVIWNYGEPLWDFLDAHINGAEFRLWCDESRVWHMGPPLDGTSGTVAIGSLTALGDTLSREDWAEVVVLQHVNPDTNVTQWVSYQSGTGSNKVMVVRKTATAAPTTTAALALLRRIVTRGRKVSAESVSNYAVTPGQTAYISTPLTTINPVLVSAVTWDFPSDEMTVATRDLST